MYNRRVRTTIELKPEHRSRLLELAARRGEKGFSSVIGEALDLFLEGAGHREHLLGQALKQRGSFSEAEAAQLRREADALRRRWR